MKKGYYLKSILCFVCGCIWSLMFKGTVSYISTFVALSVAGSLLLAVYTKNDGRLWTRAGIPYYVLAIITSFFFVINDYSIFINGNSKNLLKAFVAFILGSIVLSAVYVSLAGYLDGVRIYLSDNNAYDRRKVMWLSLISHITIDSIYLFLCCYPGWINADTQNQIIQFMTGQYDSHHPYWHTRMLECVYRPVYSLTGDGNAAMAVFCILQIIIMAVAFTYISLTLYDLRIRKEYIYIIILIHAIMPYNIGMSCALEKDGMWSATVLFFTTALFRMIRQKNNIKKTDVAIAIFGLIGMCLLRTNGVIVAFIALFAYGVSCVYKGREKRSVIYPMLLMGILVITVVSNSAFIKYKAIPQPDIVEALSIPLQQIARASYDEKEISEDEEKYIDSFGNYDTFGSIYDERCSDNIKLFIRDHGNVSGISENKTEFLKVWFSIGIRNPYNYLKAWVDETRGFWGPSYYYSVWGTGIADHISLEEYGIHRVEKNNVISKMWNVWNDLFVCNKVPFLEVVLSCGLRFWSMVFLIIWTLKKKDRGVLICIVPVALYISLFLFTPVSNTFRYAYPVFAMWPFVTIGIIHSCKMNTDPSSEGE